jgi:phosphotransferase system enzyme I (PtsI)
MQAENSRPEVRLQGIAAAPGVSRGPAYLLFQGKAIIACEKISDVESEIRRFESALSSTRVEIAKLRNEVVSRLGENEAAIFDAHLLVLEDVALIDDVSKEVRQTELNIEHCFQEVAQRYIDIFERMEDDFLRERASDIRDVTGRVMNHLLGARPEHKVQSALQQVVVAKDLTPSETATLPTDGVLAFATEEGGQTGHSAIMARALSIPAVVGVKGLLAAIEEGDTVLVDGLAGLVIVNPTSATIENYRGKEIAIRTQRDRVMQEIRLPDCTRDGHTFAIQANIGGPEDMLGAHEYYAHGVGLYRTENLFLRLDDWPSEEEQYAEYAEVVRRAQGKTVTFRTLDLGGDKRLGDLTDEANPFMGYRAIRLCLDRPDIFRPQLRAILRAAVHGSVAVMFPMISSLDELRQAKQFFHATLKELVDEGVIHSTMPRLGAMIEIPSAALLANHLARELDFFSVGTNDLVQYLLAVDRGNQRIAKLYDPANPAVISTLETIFRAAQNQGIAAAVCGELAGDPHWAPLLIGLGAHELSMTPTAIPEVRYVLRHSTLAELKDLVVRVQSQTEGVVIKKILSDFKLSKLNYH